MPKVITPDATLHVEIDGEGAPVTVLAHGLTNSCRELAQLTPLLPGTKVRFCFRGHGHSSAPATGFAFADFARDLDAVAGAFGATSAIGTSLGAGAICHLLVERPDRFERIVLLLPAGLDRPFRYKDRFLRTADALETKPRDEAVEAILADPDRMAVYARAPWIRDIDRQRWVELVDPAGLARAIREVIEDHPVDDRELLRRVEAPVFVISREGDPVHPAKLGRILAELFPNAELEMFPDEAAMFAALPATVARVREFLEST